VISKFELAGALAEQMAVLGEPDAEEAAGNGQPEATVHQLHARDDTEEAPSATNVIELAAPVEWGTTQVEPDPPAVEVPETPVEEEPAAASEALEPAPAEVEPEEEPQPVEAHGVGARGGAAAGRGTGVRHVEQSAAAGRGTGGARGGAADRPRSC
jgi:hypothetical protein